MATETEIKLSLSARAASALAKQAMLSNIERQRQLLINTYYDTQDKRLRRERMVVRHRQKGRQWLLTVKTAPMLTAGLAQRSEWEVPSRPGEFDFSHIDGGVRDLLESLRDDLQPAFTTHFMRDTWLLEPHAGVRIELALDRGWIEARGQRQTIREIELELLAGEVGDLFELVAELQASLPLHPESSSKSERAYRLLADLPLTAVKALPVPTEAAMSRIGAFRLIALSCLNHLQNNEAGVCRSDDPEFVHQARVAIRRLRSAIRLWQPLLQRLSLPASIRSGTIWRANWVIPATGMSFSRKPCPHSPTRRRAGSRSSGCCAMPGDVARTVARPVEAHSDRQLIRAC